MYKQQDVELAINDIVDLYKKCYKYAKKTDELMQEGLKGEAMYKRQKAVEYFLEGEAMLQAINYIVELSKKQIDYINTEFDKAYKELEKYTVALYENGDRVIY